MDGPRDSRGKPCSVYLSIERFNNHLFNSVYGSDSCGAYDDNDFKAKEICCPCIEGNCWFIAQYIYIYKIFNFGSTL